MSVFYKLDYINTVLILQSLKLSREIHRVDPDFEKLPEAIKRTVTSKSDTLIKDMEEVLSHFEDEKSFQKELERIIKNN
jgi:hypothetical protein